MDKIIAFLKKHQTIQDAADETVLRYGLELLLNACASILLLLFLGYLTGYLPQTIIFYLTYLYFKKDTGGYHAGSHIGCILQYNLTCLILFLLYRHQWLQIHPGLILISLYIFVYAFAPVLSSKKKIPEKQILRHKKAARCKCMIVTLFCLCIHLFHLLPSSWEDFLYLGLLMICLTILLGVLENTWQKRKKIHENDQYRNM